jgi:hypothetical protein
MSISNNISISNNMNKSNLQSSICYEVRGESPTDDISGKLFVNFKIQGPGKAPCPICGIFIGIIFYL